MSTIAERVAAGAAFLDEREPGWWHEINLDVLELNDCRDCVLGQLAGHFDDALENLSLSDARATEFGFMEAGPFVNQRDYPALTAEWKRVITGRRSA